MKNWHRPLLGAMTILITASPAFAAGAQNYLSLSSNHRGSRVSTTVPDTDEIIYSGTSAFYGNRYGVQIYSGATNFIAEVGLVRYGPGASVITDYYVQWVASNGTFYMQNYATSNPATGTPLEFIITYNTLTKWDFQVIQNGTSMVSGGVTTLYDNMNRSHVSILSDNGCKSKVSGYSHRFWDAKYRNTSTGWQPWPNSTNAMWSDGYGVSGSASGSFLSGGSVYLMTY